jgi:spore coat protein U-like protein
MRNYLTALLTAGALIGATGSALAATQTTTFNVTATVLKNCSAATAPALPFTAYTPGLGQTINVNTPVQIACTKKTPFTVSLNVGLAANGGTMAARQMGDGAGDTLQYNLYTDNTYKTVFGDTTGGSQTVGGTGAGMGTQVATVVYGQLTDSAYNQLNGAPGSYSDTITVTVTY